MFGRTKRAKGLAVTAAVILTALCCRLFYIQIVCGEELLDGARRQQIIRVETRGARGAIYDRNMVRLTERCSRYYYLLKKQRCEGSDRVQALLRRIGAEPAGEKGDDYLVFQADRYDREATEILSEEYDAYVFCSGKRYEEEQTAAHLIGYLSDGDMTGASGIEKMFQDRLSASSAKLLMLGDGAGNPMKGAGLTEQEERQSVSPSAVVTTLDAGLQEEVERILRESEIVGAAVVMQQSTGQILAMASTPSFNPEKVSEYLASDGGELVNKAMQGAYPPGSVFKIAVAAAAMESGLVDEEAVYDCRGSITVNGVKLICDDHPKGHGPVNLASAFAKSCNGYFAKLAAEIGSETIIEMAQRLGLGKPVIDGFPDEAAGRFPPREERIYSGLSNLAVGQGSLLATPVQIAQMTNIIASGGIAYPVTVAMGQEAESAAGRRVMTEDTALKMQELMKGVFTEGTASGEKLSVEAAGKTGSAESGNDGAYTVHGWFTGFFPADDPEYTVTVLAENGKTGSGSALPVFRQIAEYLY